MIVARREGEAPRSVNHVGFDRREFLALHDDLLAAPPSERLRFVGLEARRVDLIPAGVLFLATAMEVFGFSEMTISEWALREGMVLDLIHRHDPADWSEDPRSIRRASVQGLARRCNAPELHSRHVAALAVSLFDQTVALHGLTADDRELLEYAALLHDIGEHVASAGHHRHGAYLIEHGQLRGFDPAEIQLLSALVRWHRRGTPDTRDEYPLADPDRVRSLAALLRLADGLDRSRAASVGAIEAEVGPSMVLLRLRAAGDVELEEWGVRRKRELFERCFGRDLEVRTVAATRVRSNS
jgi:exopolyphosphatase/guanosine-5'-triphosphate,3'-diphosphate pyrophosphatase